MGSKLALDATAFYQGFHSHSVNTCITTRLVYEEICHIQNKLATLQALILNNRLMIFEPKIRTIRLVQSAAKQAGESRLTEADVSILALAKDYNARLVTDDFAICNLAKTMSIAILNLGTKGIGDIRKWIKYCSSCGRGYSAIKSVCPRCGNKLRARYKRLINTQIG